MNENWDKAFRQVIAYEGGFVNHPKDPGGPTNLGITQATLGRYLGREATLDEVRALTREAAKPIYKRFFWDVLNCRLVGRQVNPGLENRVGQHSGLCLRHAGHRRLFGGREPVPAGRGNLGCDRGRIVHRLNALSHQRQISTQARRNDPEMKRAYSEKGPPDPAYHCHRNNRGVFEDRP
jgi:hypothetical protein